jgi:DNA-binding XRE family transcriptional regulator
MKKKNLITIEEYIKKNFTSEDVKEIERVANQRIALREIKELREKYGYSQDTLSIKSGIPRSTISKIETGNRNVSISKLVQIANALDRDLEIRFVKRKK